MTTRTAIIGLGIMGRRMLEHMLRHPDYAPDFLWDPSEAARAEARAIHPGAVMAESAEAAMAAADLVYLACPPVPRKALALAAAGAGRAVFLEKPLGVDVAESEDLVARLDAMGARAARTRFRGGGNAFEGFLDARVERFVQHAFPDQDTSSISGSPRPPSWRTRFGSTDYSQRLRPAPQGALN